MAFSPPLTATYMTHSPEADVQGAWCAADRPRRRRRTAACPRRAGSRRILAPPLRKIFGQRAGEGTFPADAGAGTTETGSRIKGQTGKQDGCGTVGVSGNALRESGPGAAVRKRPPPARRLPCPPLRRSDSRSGNGATLSFHPSAGPEKARAEIRRRTGSGRDPPARAKGRPARTCGNTGRRQSRAGRDMASSTTRNTRCISNTGWEKASISLLLGQA